ncbi:hypothetical protein FH972_024144 [Carpinus fangiana]|uniref:RING-type domain-containing protein n=1 Tax=Carpinus fangiana TaxID=176857 RepID=A0A5N6KY02_9ROSI|nr:hypothetical protein FH972_024144 [Carpinus fangiana]
MPPRPARTLFTLIASAVFVTLLLYLTTNPQEDVFREFRFSHSSAAPFEALFSFHAPSAFFTPTATVSLTDDNSTYFAARPAAFGSLLPNKGLSGRIWIGSGFSHDSLGESGLVSSREGELACGDTPGWVEREWVYHGIDDRLESSVVRADRRDADSTVGSMEMSDRLQPGKTQDEDMSSLFVDDTDDYEHYPPPGTDTRDPVKSTAHHYGSQRRPQKAQIAGKIALLSRGGCGFSEKVKWAQRRGAIAVIVGDNIRGGPLVRMYATGDTSNITIPSLFTSHTTAHLLSSLIPEADRTGRGYRAPYYPHSAARLEFDARAAALDSDTSTLAATRAQSWPRSLARRFNLYEARATFSRGRVSSFLDKIEDLWSSKSTPSSNGARNARTLEDHEGLWVTLTPTNMSTSPFLNTLFVLVVSPLVTLAVVYTMLLIRSRIRRRRWRAPKSIVERLPVRVYHVLSRSRSSTTSIASPAPIEPLASLQTQTTPLLADSRPADLTARPRTRSIDGSSRPAPSSSRYGSFEPISPEAEKSETGLAAWKKKYGGKQVECVVCLEEYVDGISKVMSLPCGHEFHVDCITPWLTTRRRTCPICKGDVVRSLVADPAGAGAGARDEFGGMSEDDVQVQAGETVNTSPSAAMPVPQGFSSYFGNPGDLEGGQHQQPDGSSSTGSWYESIQRHIDALFSTTSRPDESTHQTATPDRNR